jgi:hypothetical protein
MVWVFPDRESTRAVPKWEKAFWFEYQEVAAELGLTWTSHPPDDIAVDCMGHGKPRVYVAGEEVTPEDTLFVLRHLAVLAAVPVGRRLQPVRDLQRAGERRLLSAR